MIAEHRPVAAGFSLRKKPTLKGAATEIFDTLIWNRSDKYSIGRGLIGLKA
jgi:hypothetical protein